MTRPANPSPVPGAWKTPVLLVGSLADESAAQICADCKAPCQAGGGVKVTVSKWVCAACWKLRAHRMRRGG